MAVPTLGQWCQPPWKSPTKVSAFGGLELETDGSLTVVIEVSANPITPHSRSRADGEDTDRCRNRVGSLSLGLQKIVVCRTRNCSSRLEGSTNVGRRVVVRVPAIIITDCCSKDDEVAVVNFVVQRKGTKKVVSVSVPHYYYSKLLFSFILSSLLELLVSLYCSTYQTVNVEHAID